MKEFVLLQRLNQESQHSQRLTDAALGAGWYRLYGTEEDCVTGIL
jgi:hypothetical protein